MQTLKAVITTLGCLVLLTLLAIYGGTRWIANNQDEIVKKVDQTVGMGKLLTRQCEQLETRFQREWDDAVNNDTIDKREGEFAGTRREIDQLCGAK